MPAVDASREFERLAAPHRRAIQVHCYRMMGSLHEAEDLVQETYLRAWRGYGDFAGGSLRSWLYRIATNACLTALESRKRAPRLLPPLVGPANAPMAADAAPADLPWLEPYPDAALEDPADAAATPEARYTSREAVQLAFVAAIQLLPPRQRAALLLCDVLGWGAAEAAELLEGSAASIRSALQRARQSLADRGPEERAPAPTPEQEKLLSRYLRAWESHDTDLLRAVLREDASAVMPPWREWYQGREAIGAFFAERWKSCAGLRLLPVAASGQPGFAVYQRGADGRFAAHSLQVLSLGPDGVSSMALFLEPGLVAAFGLPEVLPEGR